MASRAVKLNDPKISKESVPPKTAEAAAPSADAIATRAYELWQQRGCPIGSPEIDWFHAEQEFRTTTA